MNLDQLIKLGAPYFHIAVGDTTSLSNLQVQARELNKTEFKVIRGKKCRNITGLMDEWAAALQFPDYFGENWAAFDECLNDLDWLPADKYILFIMDAHLIFKGKKKTFEILIDILKNTIQEWTEGRYYDSFPTEPTPFHIIFQCSDIHKEIFQKRLVNAGIKLVNIFQLEKQDKALQNFQRAHQFCKNNKENLVQDQICGCFYCLKMFDSMEIEEWIDTDDDTAICPYCGIDSVIGYSSGFPITQEFLRGMKAYWF
ncbi:hypothetical protein C1N83_20805 [Priestia aryabhattai]